MTGTIYIYKEQAERSVPMSFIILSSEKDRAISEIFAMQRMGRYDSVVVVSDTIVRLEKTEVARDAIEVNMRFIRDKIEYESYLVLVTHCDFIIKIRFTYPSDLKKDGLDTYAAFLQDFETILKSSIEMESCG